MKPKAWLIGWIILVLIPLGLIGHMVYTIDPFFHYHKPDMRKYFYILDNERAQNDGIIKHFDYDAIIIGSSVTENFKTSEMDSIWGTSSIKVPFSGGTYKEVNDNLQIALERNPDLKIVIRAIDLGWFAQDKNAMRYEPDEYPTYLYDSNPFNDVKYLFNGDVIWNRIYPMIKTKNSSQGITSFDSYASWHWSYGVNTVLRNGFEEISTENIQIHLTDEERETIRENIEQNITSLANKYPDVDFYYYFTPNSIAWWQLLASRNSIYKQLEEEQYVIELILESENISLFSFNNRFDIITDLNNYCDVVHYGEWINSLILLWIHNETGKITKENYLEYLNEESRFYLSYDYMSIMDQEDYVYDLYSAALHNQELTGSVPVSILSESNLDFNLVQATIIEGQHEGQLGILCKGTRPQIQDNKNDYDCEITDKQYIGASIEVKYNDDYRYLVCYGKKICGQVQPTITVYDIEGNLIKTVGTGNQNLEEGWHQYLIDISKAAGSVNIVLNCKSDDNDEFEYVFSDLKLY